MALQTYEEQELLRKIQRIDRKVDVLETLVKEILDVIKPKFPPTGKIVVIPAKFD